MLQPHRAVVIDCETTDLPGAIAGKVGYWMLRNMREPQGSVRQVTWPGHRNTHPHINNYRDDRPGFTLGG
jgi:hypothetical protein